MKLGMFIIYVSDQQKARDFYAEVLQLQPTLDVPGMTEFSLSGGGMLGLMPDDGIAKILQDKTPHPATGSGIPRCELYLLDENITACTERAISMGAKIISEAALRNWGDTVVYLSDLDGHVIAFAERG